MHKSFIYHTTDTKIVNISNTVGVTIFEIRKEVEKMANYQYMMGAQDIAAELNCSKSHAYKLLREMNKELSAQGYITMSGRIPKAYWATITFGCQVFVKSVFGVKENSFTFC
jgi:hypothetical protein